MTGFEIQQNARIKAYLNRNKPQSNSSPLPLDALLKKNSHTLVVMSPDEFWDFMKKYYQRKGYSEEGTIQLALQQLVKKGHITEAAKQEWEENRTTIKSAGGLIPSFLDAKALSILAIEMKRGGNLFSKFRIQNYAGASYIILKGNPALRHHLTGTRYLASNPKVLSMGLGKAGAANAIRGGGIVTVIFSVWFHGMDQLMRDELTWHHFVGGLAADVVIAAAAAGISWVAAGAFTAATGIVIGPLIAVIAVGVVVGLFLPDSYYNGLSQYFAKSLMKMEKHLKLINYSRNGLISYGKYAVSNNIKKTLDAMNKDINKQIHSFKNNLSYANKDPEGFLHRLFSLPDMRNFSHAQ